MLARGGTNSVAVVAIAAAGSLSTMAVVYFVYRKLRKGNQQQSRGNKRWQRPFDADARRTREPLETNRDVRNARLKRQFEAAEVPSDVDAIVIGSGIGGLSVAAILAKTGRKCLVLEQHGRAGGSCHTFTKDNAEFDVGIHYVGEMNPGNTLRFFLDQITEGQLDWAEMDPQYDQIVLEDENATTTSSSKLVTIPVMKNVDKFVQSLIDRYPADEAGIREFFRLLDEAYKLGDCIGMVKLMPKWTCRLLNLVYPRLRKFSYYYHKLKLQDVLEKVAPNNKQLQMVLSYCWGDLGVEPTRSAFGIHACIFFHFLSNGGYYPVGGAGNIAYTIIPVIEKAGGRVLVKARVKEILLADDNDGQTTAIGVRVAVGKNQVMDIRAPLVISATGVMNTFAKLLPPAVAQQTQIGRLLQSERIKPSFALFQIFVVLSGPQEELNLPKKNYYVTYDKGLESLSRWQNLSLEEATQTKVPFLFFGFPSAKDPTYNERYPDRSVCIILTATPSEWFKPWANEPKGKRSAEYNAAKMALAEQAWEQVTEIFPAIADRRRWMDAGSPLTAQHYLNAIDGQSYGLDHDAERFSPDIAMTLRPEISEIKGLYLAGQDVSTCGFTSAMISGYVCAHAILQSTGESNNLIGDAVRLYKQSRS